MGFRDFGTVRKKVESTIVGRDGLSGLGGSWVSGFRALECRVLRSKG